MNSDSQHENKRQADWESWLAAHAGRLLLFARQQARCEADAQDLVQEAVVESWQEQRDGGPPALGVVFSKIRFRAIDLARRLDRQAHRHFTALAGSPEPWFDASLEDRERKQVIEAAMRSLPSIYRDVITLKLWGELTFDQVARVLEIPANTAASRYRYGLAELRKRMKEVLV